MRRAVVSLTAVISSLALVPASAAADGLPVPMDGFGPASVTAPGGDGPRYGTVAAGRNTQLLRIDQDGGEILDVRGIEGEYTVPLVALDGTPSGLSADGSTLALINPRTRFPRRETSFVIVDVTEGGAMRPRPPLTLRGDFSFDALSPDGETMYLVEYTSADYNDYAVREYDLRRERLLPDPVLVAHELAPDEMRGLPMTRATSSDGRWEFTLYDGGGGRGSLPFIHVLDTVRGISHCIDLPMVDGNEAFRLDLGLADDGGALEVMRRGTTLASLDTETFALSRPLPPGAAATGGGGPSAALVGGLVVIVALASGVVAGLVRRRRRGDLPVDPFGEGEPREPTAEREPVAR